MRQIFLPAAAILFLSAGTVRGGESAMAFLLVPPGARSSAMGGSTSALGGDAESLAANPAGPALAERSELSFQHHFYVEDAFFDNAFWTRRTAKGYWGVHAGFMSVRGLTRTIADPALPDGYREFGGFSTNHWTLALSLGRRITDHFSLGASARFARESLADAAANGAGVDAGVIASDPALPVRFGASVQNLGPKVSFRGTSEDLPALARLGLAAGRPDGPAFSWIPKDSFLTLEFSKRIHGGDSVVGAGAEVPLLPRRFTARAGYSRHIKNRNLGSKASLPNGVSFGLGMGAGKWKVDYALNSAGDLGITHRIGLAREL